MGTVKAARHWLDKAAPKYWDTKGYWRVRLMRQGTPFQWVLKAGKGDPSSTGKALATAEWWSIKADVQRQERAAADSSNPFPEITLAEERQHNEAQAAHWDYQNSGLADKLSFTDYLAFLDFRRFREAQPHLAQAADPIALLPVATEQPFASLLTLFRASLQVRFDETDHTGKLKKKKTDLGHDRFDAYKRTLGYVESVVGSEPITPIGEFRIAEARYAQILGKFMAALSKERAARQVRIEAENEAKKNDRSYKPKPSDGGHWYNEHVKTIRLFTTYLSTNRLVSAVPPNLTALLARYETEEKANPMPVRVARAFLDGAKDEVGAYCLLSINCGFRQAELATLERKHLKTISGRLCVVKGRGKTGVEYAIPLWPETIKAIEKHGRKEGLLFLNSAGRPLVDGLTDSVYNRFATLRKHVAKKLPEAAHFNFENFRDTGSSFTDSVNPTLTPLYLGQTDSRQAKQYVANVEGEIRIPLTLGEALDKFRVHLGLAK